MNTVIEAQRTLRLRTVIVQAAQHCSQALSKWFQRPVQVRADGFEHIAISEVGNVVGDPEAVVVAIRMELIGELSGDILLAIPEKTACMICDVMMAEPVGTRSDLGEVEMSCLQETANIVGSALTNSLSNWAGLNVQPSSPEMVHDLACATIEPVIASQAADRDQIMMARSTFELDGLSMPWGLFLLPSRNARDALGDKDAIRQTRRVDDALDLVASSAGHHASDALSKWFNQTVELRTNGFEMVPLNHTGELLAEPETPVVALHLLIEGAFTGHILIAFREPIAFALIDALMQQPRGTTQQLDEDGASCLQETANIVASAFVNSVGDWLDRTAAPGPPKLQHDLACALISPIVTDLAATRDDVLICRVDFLLDGASLDWAFLMAPPAEFAELAYAEVKGLTK